MGICVMKVRYVIRARASISCKIAVLYPFCVVFPSVSLVAHHQTFFNKRTLPRVLLCDHFEEFEFSNMSKISRRRSLYSVHTKTSFEDAPEREKNPMRIYRRHGRVSCHLLGLFFIIL